MSYFTPIRFSVVVLALLGLFAGGAWAAGRPGDANGDGMVDMTDYGAWYNNYGKTGATLADGDFDGSGVVDMADYAMWFNNYGVGGAESKMCNIKVVTDSSPDYSDMDSMVRSISSNWAATKDKAWAHFYWNHIARRQTTPMWMHGYELTDPIRQYNDYGYTMCSTVAGINSTTFNYMGIPTRYWEINNHTVMEVMYEDGIYHMHDSSMTALYNICDNSRLAGVEEIGAYGQCAASNNVNERAHIALYHCLYATGSNSYLTGADSVRDLQSEGDCFDPAGAYGTKRQDQYKDWDYGHRYILNFRQHETYARSFASSGSVPGYYVPNPQKTGTGTSDPESFTKCHIRGNGQWTFTPPLNSAGVTSDSISMTSMQVIPSGTGFQPASVNQAGEVVYKLEGANVICSTKIDATFTRATTGDVNAIDVSVNNGLTWTNVWTNTGTGTALQSVNVVDQVNGYYEVLVKIRLMGQTSVANARLTTLVFTTITEVNSKTQPKLRLGRNTVYVDKGEQSGSVVIWPELAAYRYRVYSTDESNISSRDPAWVEGDLSRSSIWATNSGQAAYVVFKLDTPGPMSTFTYGGRLYNRGNNAHIDLLHSFDNGATWTQDYRLTDTSQPWDVIHYETITNIPQSAKSVLVKYLWNSDVAGRDSCGVYMMRMEANYWPGDTIQRPLEVRYSWKERQTDYSTITRSHVQLVPSLPYSYVINVGGADHPVMDNLQVNVQGAAGPVTYGYSDGNDVGGTKFQDRWVTYGRNLALNKSYTFDKVSGTANNAGDTTPPTKLTDGIVFANYAGGGAWAKGPSWSWSQGTVNITLDLGSVQSCGAFRIQMQGSPFWDSMIGQVKDVGELKTSNDNITFTHAGTFNFNLRWKDFAANYMWPDNEQATGPNFELIPAAPISARYVRYCLTPWGTVAPKRGIGVTEIQVYDSITYVPFDMKLAPPPAFAGGGSTASSPPSGAGGAAPNAQAPKKQTTKKPFAPSRSVTPVLIRKTTK